MPRDKQQLEKHVVVVSREWHHPAIKVDVIDVDGSDFNGIAISMALADFVEALGKEYGATPETQAALEEAATRVVTKMKHETTRVI